MLSGYSLIRRGIWIQMYLVISFLITCASYGLCGLTYICTYLLDNYTIWPKSIIKNVKALFCPRVWGGNKYLGTCVRGIYFQLHFLITIWYPWILIQTSFEFIFNSMQILRSFVSQYWHKYFIIRKWLLIYWLS